MKMRKKVVQLRDPAAVLPLAGLLSHQKVPLFPLHHRKSQNARFAVFQFGPFLCFFFLLFLSLLLPLLCLYSLSCSPATPTAMLPRSPQTQTLPSRCNVDAIIPAKT